MLIGRNLAAKIIKHWNWLLLDRGVQPLLYTGKFQTTIDFAGQS